MQISKKNLRFDINAISEFDYVSDISFFELVQQISESAKANQGIPITISQIRTLVYAGILHSNEDLTITQAGDLMEEFFEDNDLTDLMEILAEAIMESSIFKSKSKNARAGKTTKPRTKQASTSENG